MSAYGQGGSHDAAATAAAGDVSQRNNVAGGGMARVTFRVRAEGLGHGEAVFLWPDVPHARPIPLYTTASAHPWYTARAPVSLELPVPGGNAGAAQSQYYNYRYAVFRAGVFYRWEDPVSDAPDEVEVLHHHSASTGLTLAAGDGDVAMGGTAAASGVAQGQGQGQPRHRLPLRLLAAGELYTVNDVLGVTNGSPDIDHIRVRARPSLTDLSSLHRRHGSADVVTSRGSFAQLGKSGSAGILPGAPGRGGGGHGGGGSSRDLTKKKVGFAPQPAPYHREGSGVGGRNEPKKEPVHLDSTDGLVVASAFLPVHLHRSDDGRWSADWDYEALLSMQTHLRVTRVGVVKWRGWHGNKGADGSPEGGVPMNERHNVEACLRPFNCVPVWVEPAMFGEMYNGFCKGVLWPILHNVTSVYSSRPQGGSSNGAGEGQGPLTGGSGGGGVDAESISSASTQFSEYCMDDVAQGPIHGDGGREAALWSAYTAVNRQFADVIVQCFNEGDLIWIHGFHLLILPSFLARRVPMAKIGIFLHTPFPSSEIFRTVWCREDLLRGMLNADQVGFHLFEYARHFLTCCRRLLGLNYGMIPDESGGHNLAIESNGRHVTVTSIHAGIEPPVLSQILGHPSTMEKAFSIRSQFRGKVIFCAIDRMESLKGIPLKMLGLERFLNRCPEWVGKIVLVQVGISAFERGDDYVRTKSEVLSIVANINRTWPGTVQFQECSESEMRLQQRMALMKAADVVMVTPIRDGLNLIPLEFTIAHQDALSELGQRDGRKRGLCILSEFSSCTRVMRGALHVNPWKISEIANAFHQALVMSEDERMRRISCASEFVTRVTTQRWALAVMLDLKGVHKNVDIGRYSGAGLGLGYRLLGMDTGFVSLDINSVVRAYKKAHSRLILLDYGGTILSNDNLDNLSRFQMVTNTRAPSLPTEPMVSALKELCGDKRNIVFVVSGKERHSLTKALGSIPNLGLAAEHGMFVSWPTNKVASKRRWETIVPDQDRSWRSIAITIMEVYTSRTHGSYIEETEMKVLWQYRDSDPEFGYLQSRELEDHLSNVLRSFSVDILHGGVQEGGYVEVRPKGVNKGVVAMHVIKNVSKIATRKNTSKIDFALVLGDDHCDEPMLSVMRQIGRRASESRRGRHSEQLPPLPSTITLVDVSPCDPYVSSEMETFTCTVGKKPSAAANYLNDVDEVTELMESLVKVALRDREYPHSSIDLRILSPTGTMPSPGGFLVQNQQINNAWGQAETTSAGLVKSLSEGELHPADGIDSAPAAEPVRVSANLSDFLGSIEDPQVGDDDDDGVFF